MSSFSSFGTAVSGLHAAQAGLYVIGHNMANSSTEGYSRQRTLQSDFSYRNVGMSGNGAMQVGLGTNIISITQIRDVFLDKSYRAEVTKATFYDVKGTTGMEIETIFGELQSDYYAQSVFQDMWDAINHLNTSVPGLDTRENFMSTVKAFVTKANNISTRLIDYQRNLDLQIRQGVIKVNQLLEKIHQMNGLIVANEMAGDHANDYRDARNLALDELSQYLDISYKEAPNGRVDVQTEGKELLMGSSINKLGLRYTSADYGFVEPVLTNSSDILPYDAPLSTYKSLFDYTNPIDSANGNDGGRLKGLIVARGFKPANYMSEPGSKPVMPVPSDPLYVSKYAQYQIDLAQYNRDVFDSEYSMIPKLQKEFDTLIHEIVTSINDAVAPYVYDPTTNKYIKDPNAPYGLGGIESGSQYVEVFVRKTVDRFNPDGTFNEEKAGDHSSLYSMGNLMVNPELLNTEGYNKLALSASGDADDINVVVNLLAKWESGFVSINGSEPLNVNDAYAQVINNVGAETSEALNFSKEQMVLITQIDNKRLEQSGVSLDEEMTRMLMFQHAYNAASRTVNTIDSMIDKIINGMGRAGL